MLELLRHITAVRAHYVPAQHSSAGTLHPGTSRHKQMTDCTAPLSVIIHPTRPTEYLEQVALMGAHLPAQTLTLERDQKNHVTAGFQRCLAQTAGYW